MLTQNVALVPEPAGVGGIKARELTKVGAALQKQTTRDFGPIWGIEANVSAFARLEDVPVDYWPILIVEDVEGAAGVHLDDNGQPYALVEVGAGWSLTASHETLEMLADPYGNRLVAGRSPKRGQGRVQFLVEVCDPCEAEELAYTVNGVLVSDFYTPRFFDPVSSSAVRYDYMGAITKARQVLRGGYLSWVVPSTGDWWQARWFSGNKVKFVNLGPLTGRGSLRSQIDALTSTMQRVSQEAKGAAKLTGMRELRDDADYAAEARANSLRKQVRALAKSARSSGGKGRK
jgi:hypothetical protein